MVPDEPEIAGTLRDAGARFGFAFGSRATGEGIRPDSDLDVAAWWGGPHPAPWELDLPETVDLLVAPELRADQTALAAVKYRFITALEGCVRVARHITVSEGGRPGTPTRPPGEASESTVCSTPPSRYRSPWYRVAPAPGLSGCARRLA